MQNNEPQKPAMPSLMSALISALSAADPVFCKTIDKQQAAFKEYDDEIAALNLEPEVRAILSAFTSQVTRDMCQLSRAGVPPQAIEAALRSLHQTASFGVEAHESSITADKIHKSFEDLR